MNTEIPRRSLHDLTLRAIFLGTSIFAFGVLKFFDPFHSWYLIQIMKSELPAISMTFGMGVEIAIGILLLLPFAFPGSSIRAVKVALSLGSLGLILMMAAAIYVHLHPAVPAEVLPLKIKPPVIPLIFMSLGILNFFKSIKLGHRTENPAT
jgi:hypothetical protein